MHQRVVITGLGAVSPLGGSVEDLWTGLMAGRSGIGPITHFDASAFPVRFGGQVHADFDPSPWLSRKELKKLDRFSVYGISAAMMALQDSGLVIDDDNADDVAVYVGSGVGGLESASQSTLVLQTKGPRKVSPYLTPKILINLLAGNISIATGARGPNYGHVGACATGNIAIGEALRLIRHGYAKAVIAGGAEASIIPLSMSGFAKMRALSTRNDEPTRASRPFDKDRDGFVIGEGAGVVVLEEYDSAVARGARIYCELAGYASNSDAYHMTAPHPDGRGASACMRKALRDAGWAPEDVDYINAHGTSTPYNDAGETAAIKAAFGDHAYGLAVSSTKSMTGHLMGAAGGIEAVICALAIDRGWLPPTINLDTPDPKCDLDYVPHKARQTATRRVLSNGFGFGGTNSTLAFAALEG